MYKKDALRRPRLSLSLKPVLMSMMLVGLSACEANLDLTGVASQRQLSVKRTDQFMAMTASADQVTLVGDSGVIVSSDDDGKNWSRTIVNPGSSFIDIDTCPDNTIAALSFDKQVWTGVAIQPSSWASHTIDTIEDLQSITCAKDNSYWVTGSFSSLFHSQDGGESWKHSTMDEDALFTKIQFFDQDNGYVGGEFGTFFKTSDGGNSWTRAGIIGEEFYPLDIWFKDPLNGWAVGLNSIIFSTTDGGDSWSLQEVNYQGVPIYKIVGNNQHVYAIGDQGTVLTLRGTKWHNVESPKTPVYLNSGQILNSNQLLVAGGWGTILTIQSPAEK
jgi:photosystem II stability/assembly factor-like uncharacterized protein